MMSHMDLNINGWYKRRYIRLRLKFYHLTYPLLKDSRVDTKYLVYVKCYITMNFKFEISLT